MAALGRSLSLQRHVRAGRAHLPLRCDVLSRHGVGTMHLPAQVAVCSLRLCKRQSSAFAQSRRRRGRQLVFRAVAMVNVDFASPSLLLGTMLIGCGVLLLNLRNFQNKVSRDADIVVAAMVSIVGSTLIFQGWRLDPLLLLCQALTTSVAFWYGLETFRLRSKEPELPPPQLLSSLGMESASLDAVQQAAAAAAQQQQQQYYQPGVGFPPAGSGAPYLPPGTESYYTWGNTPDAASSTSGRSLSPGGVATGPYGETIQYDYYGNPIMPPEVAYSNAANVGANSFSSGAMSYGEAFSPSEGAASLGGGLYGASGGSVTTASSVGYDTRAPAAAAPGLTYGGPFDAAPPQPRGPLDDGQQQQPAVSTSSVPNGSSSTAGGGSFFGADPFVSSAFGSSFGSLYDGFGTGSSTGTDPWDSTSSAGTASPPPAGPSDLSGVNSNTGAGRRDKLAVGRLDLYEQVDDWE